MPIYVGKNKRYTEDERQEILKKSLSYTSLQNAAKNLGVSKETLTWWMEERNFLDKFYRASAKNRYKKMCKAFSCSTIAEGAIRVDVSPQTVRAWMRKYGITEAERKKKFVKAKDNLEVTRNIGKKYSEKEQRQFAKKSLKYDSTTTASLHFGVGRQSLVRWCNKFGVPVIIKTIKK